MDIVALQSELVFLFSKQLFSVAYHASQNETKYIILKPRHHIVSFFFIPVLLVKFFYGVDIILVKSELMFLFSKQICSVS